jgi:hypothetical protein
MTSWEAKMNAKAARCSISISTNRCPLPRPAGEYPSSAKLLADARRHPGVWVDIEAVLVHDVPVWLAAGVDSIGLACNHMLRDGMYESEAWGRARDSTPSTSAWKRFLHRKSITRSQRRPAPRAAGSASGVLQNPVGYNRVYVHVAGELTWEKWWHGLRAGRCCLERSVVALPGQRALFRERACRGEDG